MQNGLDKKKGQNTFLKRHPLVARKVCRHIQVKNGRPYIEANKLQAGTGIQEHCDPDAKLLDNCHPSKVANQRELVTLLWLCGDKNLDIQVGTVVLVFLV